MSLLRRGFRKVFTLTKRKYAEGGDVDICPDPYPSPGPGWVGSNLPFQTDNLPRFLCLYIVYIASGLGFPFYAYRCMTIKAAR